MLTNGRVVVARNLRQAGTDLVPVLSFSPGRSSAITGGFAKSGRDAGTYSDFSLALTGFCSQRFDDLLNDQ